MQQIGKVFIEEAGTKAPQDLNIEDVRRAFGHFSKQARTTAYKKATLMRRMLRDLRDEHGIPKLWQAVPRIKQAPPRDVTVSEEEREKLIQAANPHMQCLILLCSDLAIRSGTAAKLAPEHYDPKTRRLSFTTKYDERLSLPVTERLAFLIDQCMAQRRSLTPFVNILNPRGHAHPENLRAAFKRLCVRVGIKRRITLHDLRRTTAVGIYDLTHDLRMVQAALGHSNLMSTLHYLDHRMTTVPRALLEKASENNRKETVQ